MPTNIGDGGIAAEGIARISSEDADRLKQHKLNLGDVVFSRRGDVTRNALIQSHEVGWLCGTGCLKVRLGNESRAKAKFIAYCLRLPETKEWLVRHAVGATMPNLNTSILSAVPMLLPPMDIQEEASGMLGALDDKIALLRETNATLEAIAQALFKSWFVDFDPVRAKTEGRDPEGVPTEVADLFPSEFEDSELGAIPKGWRVGHFYDVAGLHKQVRQPQENPDTEFEHYSLPAFDAGQSPALETGSAIKSNKFTVPKDAVLLSKLNPHIPRVWLTKVVNESAAISSTEFLVLGPRRGTSREWVYLLVRSEGVQS
jgi:type I restriction enzyme S subunit